MSLYKAGLLVNVGGREAQLPGGLLRRFSVRERRRAHVSKCPAGHGDPPRAVHRALVDDFEAVGVAERDVPAHDRERFARAPRAGRALIVRYVQIANLV